MARTRFYYIFQRGITQKLRKGEQSFLFGTHSLDHIYISIKYHEDILKVVYRCRQSHAIIRPFFFKMGVLKFNDVCISFESKYSYTVKSVKGYMLAN